jgi:uncharacterized alpha-E superfamily protein
MLSRVADSLYWMSRYLERAEHTSRLLGVTTNLMLELSPRYTGGRWSFLLDSLGVVPPEELGTDSASVTMFMTFDTANPSSVVACIAASRENARQVREQISSEMWEQLNRLYLHIRRTGVDEGWLSERYEFFSSVKEGAHLFQGITDATMSHGEGWHFIQAGRFIERASATARLLDVHFRYMQQLVGSGAGPIQYLEWVALLKSCTAFEAYCKSYTANMQPERIAEFLMLDAQLPRSLRFSMDVVQQSLQAIANLTGGRGGGRAERLAGRLRASLDYGQIDEILASDLSRYLGSFQDECWKIHDAIYTTYISYPVEQALG